MNENIEHTKKIPIHTMGLKCQFYRIVKPFKEMDSTDPDHFSYNHNLSKIERGRLNKAGEPVLYTSSYPTIAERETLAVSQEFYLVKFHKTDNYEYKCFVAIDDHCSPDGDTDSKKAREAIKQHFSAQELRIVDEHRQILEKDYSNYPKDEKYEESSKLASRILKVADCILTYSKTDDGKENIPQGQESNRYLNVTFNRLATDKHLKIETIYHCKPKSNQYGLRYEILEIGIPDEQYEFIEWYDWGVDPKSIKIEDDVEVDDITIKEFIPTLMPNVCIEVCETHTNVVSLPTFGNIYVKFKINIHPQSMNYT